MVLDCVYFILHKRRNSCTWRYWVPPHIAKCVSSLLWRWLIKQHSSLLPPSIYSPIPSLLFLTTTTTQTHSLYSSVSTLTHSFTLGFLFKKNETFRGSFGGISLSGIICLCFWWWLDWCSCYFLWWGWCSWHNGWVISNTFQLYMSLK